MTVEVMKTKHPEEPRDLDLPPPPYNLQYDFNSTDIWNVIESFPNGSVQSTSNDPIYFFGARLMAITKPNGDLRPIAAGCTLRRTTGKILLQPVINNLTTRLTPIQVEVGTKMGCETAVHAVRDCIHSEHDNDKIVLKNAFNTLRRDCLLKATRDHLPDLHTYVWQNYAAASTLSFDDYQIASQTGIQQRDSLGPALFANTIHQAMDNQGDIDLNV
ncbi:hypothetical protein CAPTEDRAFT_195219 [Capitella teleta]|uniref:Reverse transcriptase domain-containing protein n=1 Tax=Capitella teleta TaxID=283909 RepID=R7V9X5_CAPTE|nr:hypothetical protein CAPTEDRAFT_195219 [Capitella teleta]|eukprot:ELU12540.1 hypothetical protein CAPTEDRAFT_195219 [Capitella teleta]